MSETTAAATAAQIAQPCILPLYARRPRLRFINEPPEGAVPAAPKPAAPAAPTPPAPAAPAAGAEEEPPEGAEELGDAGKKALDRMKEDRNAARDEAKRERAERERLQAELDAKTKTAEQLELDKARRDGIQEATEKANQRILRSEVKAAAAGKLSNPADALAFLDLSRFDVSADGDVDSDALDSAISTLLAEKPYLAAAPATRGSGDGGSRPAPLPPATLQEQIKAAEKAGDIKASMALKSQQLLDLASKQNT